MVCAGRSWGTLARLRARECAPPLERRSQFAVNSQPIRSQLACEARAAFAAWPLLGCVVNYRLRSGVRADGPALVEMIGSVLAAFELSLDRAQTDRDLDDVNAHYIEPGGLFEVLVDGGERIVGSYGMFVHCRRPDNSVECFELRKMYLIEEVQGLGWGRKMLDRGLSFARERGASQVMLETASRLEAALRLYRAYGFAQTGDEAPAQRCDLTLYLEL